MPSDDVMTKSRAGQPYPDWEFYCKTYCSQENWARKTLLRGLDINYDQYEDMFDNLQHALRNAGDEIWRPSNGWNNQQHLRVSEIRLTFQTEYKTILRKDRKIPQPPNEELTHNHHIPSCWLDVAIHAFFRLALQDMADDEKNWAMFACSSQTRRYADYTPKAPKKEANLRRGSYRHKIALRNCSIIVTPRLPNQGGHNLGAPDVEDAAIHETPGPAASVEEKRLHKAAAAKTSPPKVPVPVCRVVDTAEDLGRAYNVEVSDITFAPFKRAVITALGLDQASGEDVKIWWLDNNAKMEVTNNAELQAFVEEFYVEYGFKEQAVFRGLVYAKAQNVVADGIDEVKYEEDT